MSGEGSSSSESPGSTQAQSQGESGQKKDGAEEPREGEEQSKSSEQQSDQGQPKGNQADQPGGRKDRGKVAAEGEKEAASRPGNDVEIWGNLPIHLRDIFRAEGQGDMPARYRDWIDSYYRRLNERGDH